MAIRYGLSDTASDLCMSYGCRRRCHTNDASAPRRNLGPESLSDSLTGVVPQVQTMMQQEQRFTSTWHAVSSVVRQNGVGGLLRGYWVGNAVWLPWNAIMIPRCTFSGASTCVHVHVTLDSFRYHLAIINTLPAGAGTRSLSMPLVFYCGERFKAGYSSIEGHVIIIV